MRGRRGIQRAGATAATAAFALSGCGGGAALDAGEPSGSYPVDIVAARFPASQHLAQQSTFAITVKNTGTRPIPDLAVTLHGFSARSAEGGQADPTDPLWIVDEPPAGGATAYDDTWAAGALAPGARTTMRWVVTPVVPGRHRLSYTVAAGLGGKARARLADDRTPTGAITVNVIDAPPNVHVDPDTGTIVSTEG